MTHNDTQLHRLGPVHGAAAIIIGLAHFAAPSSFDAFNRLGFPNHARLFTYIHGGIETTLGVLATIPRTRRHAGVLGLCYMSYLTVCIATTQAGLRRAGPR